MREYIPVCSGHSLSNSSTKLLTIRTYNRLCAPMSKEFYLEKECESTSAVADVIFVHGLTGDAKKTWSTESNGEFWPCWIKDELEHLNIYTLGYPASLFAKWAKKEMDMFERAGNVLEHMTAIEIGTRPVIFVTHSLGGILAKILLRKAFSSEEEDYKKIASLTRLVIFLATPHTGASLANVLKVVPGSSRHIALLANETGFLEDLNDNYRYFANNKSDLITKVYYEKYATKKTILVVPRESADPGVAGPQPTALDKDHITICKPIDKDDIIYLGIKRHIKKIIDEIIDNSTDGQIESMGVDYSKKCDSDRRDLLEKLIDANREHEYSYANGAQNEFARSYLKTGLFTSARDDHETLLSEVETRFITHIFHPLICKNEEDSKIQEALQDKVIDAISKKKIGNTRFTARAVLSALYYLTEQCHIRWDFSK